MWEYNFNNTVVLEPSNTQDNITKNATLSLEILGQLEPIITNYVIHSGYYIINIKLYSQPLLMERLYKLLSLLTTEVHSTLLRSKVIWYDSVTSSGELSWQSQLNQLNK